MIPCSYFRWTCWESLPSRSDPLSLAQLLLTIPVVAPSAPFYTAIIYFRDRTWFPDRLGHLRRLFPRRIRLNAIYRGMRITPRLYLSHGRYIAHSFRQVPGSGKQGKPPAIVPRSCAGGRDGNPRRVEIEADLKSGRRLAGRSSRRENPCRRRRPDASPGGRIDGDRREHPVEKGPREGYRRRLIPTAYARKPPSGRTQFCR